MKSRESGFTLIELMIVIAIIAIIAAIAIPNLLAAKVASNETAAMATLKSLTSAQATCQNQGRIDADKDGQGEYGCFFEVTSQCGVRNDYDPVTKTAQFNAPLITTKINPSIISTSLGNVDTDGFVTKGGYAFMIYLPDGASPSQGTHETGSIAAPLFAARVSCDVCETVWCAYAQPMTYATSGNKRFFVNQSNDVLQSQNLPPNTKAGSGTANIPLCNGAFAATGLGGITSPVAQGTLGNDLSFWKTN